MSSKSEYLNDFWTSCDWSNDAKNSALITGINYILKYILNIKNISQYYCFCCILDQTNTGFVNRRDFFKKNKKILLFKNFWMVVYIIYIYIYIIWWWWAAWTKKCQGRVFVPVQPCLQTLLYQALHARWNENDIEHFLKTVFLQKYSDVKTPAPRFDF